MHHRFLGDVTSAVVASIVAATLSNPLPVLCGSASLISSAS